MTNFLIKKRVQPLGGSFTYIHSLQYINTNPYDYQCQVDFTSHYLLDTLQLDILIFLNCVLKKNVYKHD